MNVLDVSLYDKLYNDYNKHGSLIVAFDFDNTIRDYHRTGLNCEPVIDLLKECITLDFTLILFTVLENGAKESDWKYKYCRDLGLTKGKFYTNESPLFNESPKPYYNVLLDDRAGLLESYTALKDVIEDIYHEKQQQTLNRLRKHDTRPNG